MAAELVPVLQSLQSNNNAERSAAEQRYNQVKAQQPAVAVAALLQVIAEPQVQIPVREQSAVLLRQCLAQPATPNSIWMQLGAGQADIKARLLQVVGSEEQDKVRRKTADCLQSLANQLIDIDEDQRPPNAAAWPELLPALLQLVADSTKSAGIRADALWTIKELASSIWQCLVANAAQTSQLLQGCFTDGSPVVQATAATLLCEVAAQLGNQQDRQAFVPLIPGLFGVLSTLVPNPDAKLLCEVLQSLQTEGFLLWFFRDHIGSHLLPGLCQIAKSHPSMDARKLALEALVSLMESSPKMMLKVPNAIQMFLDACMQFVMTFDDDVNSWANLDEDDENDETKVGEKSIDRLCKSMQKEKSFAQVMAVLEPPLTSLLQQQDWKSHAAALTVFMTIAEYIDEETTAQQLVKAVQGHLQSPHVRVRYIAWFTLLQFAQDQPQAISGSACAAELLPAILAGLGDPCPRVVFACMGAFQNYGQNVEEEDLESFVQPLMEKLGSKLQGQGNSRVQREAISCIATVAGQIGDSLSQYYGALMPMLKQVIAGTLHKDDERLLLGKAFECISLLATSVGRATFRPDAEGIITQMIQATQAPNLAKDDPVYEYIMAAADRFCFVLKEDFLPFVPPLLPMILGKLKFAPKEFNGDVRDVQQDEDVNVQVVNKDGKTSVFVMQTAQMEEVQHALECVHAFVSRLGVGYATYINPTAEALLPVFDFLMSEEIRDLAFETWGNLCKCARTAGQQPVVTTLCAELMKRIIPQLGDASSEVAALKTRALGVAKCLASAGPNILDVQQVQHIGQLALQLLSNSIERRMKREQKQAQKKANCPDPDETRASEEDEIEEDALRSASVDMAGALMENHPDHFMSQCLAAWLPVVQKLISPNGNPNDRQIAGQLAGNICEHLGERAVSQWPAFMPQLLEDIQASDDDVRGTACYSVSVAARLAAFTPHATMAAQRAAQVVTQTRAQAKKKSGKDAQCAADNALSILLEVLEHHSSVVPGDLWGTWLSGLPCQEDSQEGVRNNKALLRLAQQQAPGVVGNIPRVLELLVNAFGTEFVDDETSKGIGQMLLALGEAQLTQFSANYTPKLKKKMMRVAKEAQKPA